MHIKAPGNRAGAAVLPGMTIEQISKEEFEKFPIARMQVARVVEKVWFRLENVLGAVFQDQVDRDWAFVVLLPDAAGVYRGADMDINLTDQVVAVRQLKKAMKRRLKKGWSAEAAGADEDE